MQLLLIEESMQLLLIEERRSEPTMTSGPINRCIAGTGCVGVE
jgi:hypothetical protein